MSNYELMNEDFVPFEIAKKLEKKGFNYKCLYVYNKEQIINPEVVKAFGELTDDGYYELTKEGGGKLDWSFVYINKYQLIQYRDVIIPNEMIRAPTISQVLKWLRKEKRIDAGAVYDNRDGKWVGYVNEMDMPDLVGEYVLPDTYVTYELATIAGIKYYLETLI